MPAYLYHSDACFQFYKADYANSTRNSQKLYLYLASGRPVVSIPSADCQEFGELVRLASTPEEFVGQMEEALRGEPEGFAPRRRELAMEANWERRTHTIEELLLLALRRAEL